MQDIRMQQFALALALAGAPLLASAQGLADSSFQFSGDFRLRYENTFKRNTGEPFRNARNREVVRFRASLTKSINHHLTFGARLATGSSNDPNTADVTLGSFVNDLEFSLDRVYLEFAQEDVRLSGGKMPNPFMRTDLVWDGDVNPQGVAASYEITGSDQVVPKLTGMFSIVDEQSDPARLDSYMFGAQLRIATRPADDWSVTVAGGYYDYYVRNLASADAGDTRSNNLIVDGTGAPIGYASDFDLVDAIAVVKHKGFNEGFPVKFVGNYVKNVGANVPEDQGFMLDLFVGKASDKNDARFRYGYSECDTDAVLAAFSNDNTTIPTNYKQHTVTFDYVVLDQTTLNLTWYLHKLKRAPAGADDSFVSRLRLNALVRF